MREKKRECEKERERLFLAALFCNLVWQTLGGVIVCTPAMEGTVPTEDVRLANTRQYVEFFLIIGFCKKKLELPGAGTKKWFRHFKKDAKIMNFENLKPGSYFFLTTCSFLEAARNSADQCTVCSFCSHQFWTSWVSTSVVSNVSGFTIVWRRREKGRWEGGVSLFYKDQTVGRCI